MTGETLSEADQVSPENKRAALQERLRTLTEYGPIYEQAEDLAGSDSPSLGLLQRRFTEEASAALTAVLENPAATEKELAAAEAALELFADTRISEDEMRYATHFNDGKSFEGSAAAPQLSNIVNEQRCGKIVRMLEVAKQPA